MSHCHHLAPGTGSAPEGLLGAQELREWET